jgi:hypothetical protein
MTRRRARNATQGMQLKSITTSTIGRSLGDFAMMLVIKSKSHYTQLKAVLPYAGGEATIHPNYSLPSGSGIDSTNLLGSIIATGANTGLYKNFIIKKATYTLRCENLDSIGKLLNILAIPYNSAGALGADVQSSLTVKKIGLVVSKFFNKAGVTGDIAVVKFTVEPWRIEGFSSFELYAANNGYWCTAALRGSTYTNLYVQQEAVDGVSALATGMDVQYVADFEVKAITPNVVLTA